MTQISNMVLSPEKPTFAHGFGRFLTKHSILPGL